MPTEEQIQRWKEEHGGVICSTVGEKDYYLRRPTRAEYKRLIDTSQKSVYDASYTLVISCLLDPDPKEIGDDCKDNPNLHIFLSAELQDQFGGNLGVSSKKL